MPETTLTPEELAFLAAPIVAAELRRLAAQEANDANTLRTISKSYVEGAPEYMLVTMSALDGFSERLRRRADELDPPGSDTPNRQET